MRISISLFGAACLAACATEVATAPLPVQDDPAPEIVAEAPLETPELVSTQVPEYGETWNISGGWPGEYPLGFSVLEDDVVLQGRTNMHPLTEPTVACPLDRFATYQQWNFARGDADDLDFVVANRMIDVTMTADAPIEVPAGEFGYETKALMLKSGEVLSYKRYLGEGFAIVGYQGSDYEINEAELVNVSDIDEAVNASGIGEDLWVEVTCQDEAASRAWILYDEAIRAQGIGPSPVIGYGEARDLTQEDVFHVYELMAIQAQAGEH